MSEQYSPEETRKQFATAFVRFYQRDPDNVDELMAFALACWMSSGADLRNLVVQCLQQSGTVMSCMLDKGEYNRVTGTHHAFVSRGLNLFSEGLKFMMDMQRMLDMQREVNTKLAEALEMESK